MTTAPDPLATLPPVLASKLRSLPPQQLNQILQTKEGKQVSAAEELADLIRGIDGPSTLGGLEVAEAILAAGYRKQPISPDELRAIRDDAWQRGYEACREGKQKHSPYRAS